MRTKRASRAFSRRLLAFVALVAAASSLGGCGAATQLVAGDETGSVQLVMPLSALQGESFTGAKLRLAQGNRVRELLLEVSGDVITGAVDNLSVGDWTIALDVYDREGDITHSATGAIRVRPGETATLSLEAKPREGVLEIVADIAGFSDAADVQRAKIEFHNGQTATLAQSPGEPTRFEGSKSLIPGDYDYRIELYGATTYAADRLYQSPWESVRIHPGKTVRVTWEAASGSALIEMGITQMPAPPGEVRLEAGESGELLAWTASPDPEVTTYRIYIKDDEFDSFSLRDEVPASQLTWAIPASTRKKDAWAAVTAARADKRESFRSNVVYIPAAPGP